LRRKEFIKKCTLACIGISGIGTFMQSCSHSRSVNATIENKQVILPLESFVYIKKNKTLYRKHVVVNNEKLRYPICVFRFDENTYIALLMRCPHQGVELQVFGDKLTCPAHGSEFDNHGHVLSPPADKDLRELPLIIENEKIIISLS
jgi:Rieske Fe-S protein